MKSTYVVRVPWGSWGPDGAWRHNPVLPMSATQQRAANEAAGYVCPGTDGEAGMRWWNALTDEDRAFWLKASLGDSAADAWAYFKRCTHGVPERVTAADPQSNEGGA